MPDIETLRQERDARVEQAINLQEPDQIPFVPKAGHYHLRGYDISPFDGLTDFRNSIPGLLGFLNEFQPDAASTSGGYYLPLLDELDAKFIHWPGPSGGLDLTASVQLTDETYLMDDEYDDFLRDPTHITMTRILPRRFGKLKGLSKLYFREPGDKQFFNDLAVFADPEVQETLDALKGAAKLLKRNQMENAAVRQAVREAGWTSFHNGAVYCPFDAFADCYRGIIRTVTDCYEYPDELAAALDYIAETSIDRAVAGLVKKGAKRVYIPCHCGVDEFMSKENYLRFYWPGLRRMIYAFVDAGITPVVFFEGRYNTRLDIIGDVPKGKVVYMFEQVDMAEVKKKLGGHVCLCGNLPTALLAFGTEQQVIDATKAQIDLLAPGGGFIMDCSITLDNANKRNMHAWRETTLTYGKK